MLSRREEIIHIIGEFTLKSIVGNLFIFSPISIFHTYFHMEILKIVIVVQFLKCKILNRYSILIDKNESSTFLDPLFVFQKSSNPHTK